ncbi:MAG: type II toxin-antitoxin system VapC family toxin [Anaerolineae bacterium]
MASYVVDASVVIEYLITGPYTPNAQAFFNQMTATDRLIVPEFCLLECANVVWKQVRFSGMSHSQAHDLVRVLQMLKLHRVPVRRLLDHALTIALNNTLAIYDSGYIALALYFAYPLATFDRRQAAAALAEGVSLVPLIQFI